MVSPHPGSDGKWVERFEAMGVPCEALAPSNCGFTVDWKDQAILKHFGTPLQTVALRVALPRGSPPCNTAAFGSVMVSEAGVRSGAVYDISQDVRALLREGPVQLSIDLKSTQSIEQLSNKLLPFLLNTDSVAPPSATPKLKPAQRRHFGKRGLAGSSLAYRLLRAARLPKITIPLLRQQHAQEEISAWDRGGHAESLAAALKDVRLEVTSAWPLESAISSAGGVKWCGVDDQEYWGMLKCRHGVFVAGEMLDWEAPCGGYLLTGSMSTGHAAAVGLLRWLIHNPPP